MTGGLVLLAEGGLSDPVIQGLLGILGTIAVAVIGVLGTGLARRSNRGVDDATADKLRAEARRTALDATTQEIALVRSISEERQQLALDRIEQVQKEAKSRIDQMRDEHTEDRGRADAEIKELKDRMRDYETRQRLFLASVIAHMPWDADALAALRRQEPNWQSPPPFRGVEE